MAAEENPLVSQEVDSFLEACGNDETIYEEEPDFDSGHLHWVMYCKSVPPQSKPSYIYAGTFEKTGSLVYLNRTELAAPNVFSRPSQSRGLSPISQIGIGLVSVGLTTLLAREVTNVVYPRELDKLKHSGYGVGIGADSYLIASKGFKWSKLKSFAFSIFTTAVIAAGKEWIWDASGKGHVDSRDFKATVFFGGVPGSAALLILPIGKRSRR